MKSSVKNLFVFLWEKFKTNYILFLSAIALILPDILVRSAATAPIFDEPFNTCIPLIFTLGWTSVILLFCRRLPSKIGRFVFLAVGLAMLILAFSNYVYYKIFEQYFWLNSIGLAGEAGGYIKYAMEFVTPYLALTTIFNLALLIFVTVKWRAVGKKQRLFVLIRPFSVPVLAIAVLHIILQPVVAGVKEDNWDSWQDPHVVYKEFTDANKSLSIAGLYQFAARDLWEMCFPNIAYSDEEYAEIDSFFDSLPKPEANKYTDIFKGKNVIAVMMESIDDWLIDEKYTPTIHYMMENGINFTDYHAPLIASGYTFNSEFAFHTGYYTPKSSVTAVNFSSNSFPYSVARLFRDKGYRADSFHYNTPEFYNRGIMHKSLGYEKYHSFMDYDIPLSEVQSDSLVLNYDPLYADIIKQEPFFDFIITYSGHIPYTYEDTKLAIAKRVHPELINPEEDPETNNLRILARDTDDFFRLLLTRLNNDDLLENTVIIGFTDHYAYGFSDEEKLKEYSGDMLTRVPAFMYTPGITPERVEKPMHTIDWLPTIINMFGLENNNCYIGNDIFDNRHNGFVHFEYGVWYDGNMFFNPQKPFPDSAPESYIEEQSARAKKLLRVNDIVITGDYFKKR